MRALAMVRAASPKRAVSPYERKKATEARKLARAKQAAEEKRRADEANNARQRRVAARRRTYHSVVNSAIGAEHDLILRRLEHCSVAKTEQKKKTLGANSSAMEAYFEVGKNITVQKTKTGYIIKTKEEPIPTRKVEMRGAEKQAPKSTEENAVGTVLSMGAFEQRGGGRGGGGGLDNQFANVAESDITALVLRPDSTGML